jgi:hypothetical protein
MVFSKFKSVIVHLTTPSHPFWNTSIKAYWLESKHILALEDDKDLFNFFLMPLVLFHPIHSFDIMDTNMEANMVMDYDDDKEIGNVPIHGLQNLFCK